MLKLLLLASLCMVNSAHSAKVSFEGESSLYLQQKVAEGLRLLPVDYLEAVQSQIEIEEVALAGDEVMSEDLCNLDDRVHFGLTSSRRGKFKIQISSRLVQNAQKVKKEFSCFHGTFEKVLVGTILHELTHVRDNFEKVSHDPDFQRIVGVKRIGKWSKKKILNQNISTSPDPYEFENLAEALAVNVEYMILDKEFECRRPATASFLSRKLGLKLSRLCDKNYNIITQSAYLEDNYLHDISINPSRIYQIHYLFAGKGKAIMSRWGHSMFRLVVCAPHRKVPGPECLRDVSHHLVLSYRAYITDINLSYGKGLRGKYPSQLFIMRFHEIQQEYTKYELRDLYSIPLKMSDKQRDDFIDLTLERFWSYQGKYYFLDNNCGTESQKHLAVALTEEQSKLISSITPLKMYKDIINNQNGLSEEDIHGFNRADLISRGLLIEGLGKDLKKSFQELHSFGLYKEKSFKKFLKKTSAEKRSGDYETFFNKNTFNQKTLKKIIMRLIYLERYLFLKFQIELPKKIMSKMNKSRELKTEILKMGESLKTFAIQPWEVVDGRYGVPTTQEFEEQYSIFAEKRKMEMQASTEDQMKNLQKILGWKYFRFELKEIENYEDIKKLTTELFIQANKQLETL